MEDTSGLQSMLVVHVHNLLALFFSGVRLSNSF